METTQQKLSVAVVGCGPSGLLCIRHLKDVCDVTAFEPNDEVGGTWLYTEETEENSQNLDRDAFYQLHGHLHSSLYDNLTTNLPKYFMSFKDFPHKPDTPHIMKSGLFHQYLKDYAQEFDLYSCIKFKKVVTSVRLTSGMSSEEMTSLNLPTDTTKKYCVSYASKMDPEDQQHLLFDYVFVCNGHFSKPNIPEYKGQSAFKGVQMHTHSLRRITKENFHQKKILIIGAFISANDIVSLLFFNKEVSKEVHPARVFVTGRDTSLFESSSDYNQQFRSGKLVLKKGGLKEFGEDGKVYFNDGSEEVIDTIIYGTGYKHSIPFLTNTGDNIVSFDKDEDGYFGPLYKRMFAINDPSLVFIGLVERIYLTMSTYEKQVMLAKRILLGEVDLPSKEDMLKDLEQELTLHVEKNGQRKGSFFKFNKFFTHWQYSEELLQLSKMEKDDSYEKVRPLEDEMRKYIYNGNYWSAKSLDFDELTKNIEFKPTSARF